MNKQDKQIGQIKQDKQIKQVEQDKQDKQDTTSFLRTIETSQNDKIARQEKHAETKSNNANSKDLDIIITKYLDLKKKINTMFANEFN